MSEQGMLLGACGVTFILRPPLCISLRGKKVRKGAWRMPWLTEAMKDVISCDKPRLGANDQ